MSRIVMREFSLIWVMGIVSMLAVAALASEQGHANCYHQVISKIMPCLPFLNGSAPPTGTSSCLKGARSLNELVATSDHPNRKAICECLKKFAINYKVDVVRAKQLTQLSKTDLLVEVDPNVNCDKYAHLLGKGFAQINRLKKLETTAFRPTTPGHSPGIGHDHPPSSSVPLLQVRH